jgi:hypothetical protein
MQERHKTMEEIRRQATGRTEAYVDVSVLPCCSLVSRALSLHFCAPLRFAYAKGCQKKLFVFCK